MHAPRVSRHLEGLIAQARQRLVETGTRNRLINAARFSSRSKAIDIVDERSGDVFRILVRESRRMRFRPDEKADDHANADEPLLAVESDEPGDKGRYTDLSLQTRHGEDKLRKKLLSAARDATTLEEEQGINALFLAMGFLRWYEDEKSDVLRQAPLILIPVQLIRNDRTSMAQQPA